MFFGESMFSLASEALTSRLSLEKSTELSAATGISPAGTRTRLKRLLDRLREDLADG